MPNSVHLRMYRPSDEPSWLRCRLLGFFDTAYYDDVWTTRPSFDPPSVQLVAVGGGGDDVVGILDIEVDGDLATIDTVAVLPDARGGGIATALLDRALGALPQEATTLDAWTRDDAGANSWYRRHGFVEEQHYLHVYKDHDESADGFVTPDGLSVPVKAFLHAGLEHEDAVRARYRRVHVCRRYVRPLG